MRATSRRTATALVVALVTTFVAAGLALAVTRSGGDDAQPAGIRQAASDHAIAGPRRAPDHQAVLTAGPGADAAPSSPLTPAVVATPLAPVAVAAASRGPPNLAVTVIN